MADNHAPDGNTNPLRRRLLIAAAATTPLLGVIAAIALTGADDPRAIEATRDATSTTAAPTTAPAAAGGGTGGDADREQGSTTTRAPVAPSGSDRPSAPTPPSDPETTPPASPPRPGLYTYATSTDGQDSETTLRIDDDGEVDGERRQTITRRGEDGERTSRVAWRPDGMYVGATTTASPQGNVTCDWEPDFKLLALPLGEGASWTYTTACSTQAGAAPINVKREGSFTVIRATTIDVAGQAVDTWEIHGTEEQTISGAFNGQSTEESTTYYSPAHGLEAKSTREISGSSPQGSGQTTVHQEIKDFTPR